MKQYTAIFSIAAAAATLLTGMPSNGQTPPTTTQPVDAQPAPTTVPTAPVTQPAPTATTTTTTTTTPTQTPPSTTVLPPLPVAQTTTTTTTPATTTTPVIQPIAVSAVAVTAPADTLAINLGARDAKCLAFQMIPTDQGLKEGLQAGRDFAKSDQDFIDLLNTNRRPLAFKRGGVVGELRRPTAVAVLLTPMLEARWRGFVEGRQFDPPAARDTDFDALRRHVTSPQRKLTFLVEIGDLAPAPKGNGSIVPLNSEVAAAVVRGTRFILSDDKDNNYDPIPSIAGPVLSIRQAFYDDLAPAPDRAAGDNPLAPVASENQGHGTALVKRRSPYLDMAAFYVVSFDAFNADGTARLNRDTKSLTLRVLTSGGTDSGKFEMDKME